MIGIKRFQISVIFMVAIMSAISVHLSARREMAGNREPEEKVPLRFRVIAVEPSLCAKGRVDLEIELRNISGEQVFIDPKGVFYQMSFVSDRGGKTVTGDTGPNLKSDHYLLLKENESYRTTMSYSLNDAFFSSAGIYRMKLTYGQFAPLSPTLPDLYRGYVESNVFLLEVRSCEAANP